MDKKKKIIIAIISGVVLLGITFFILNNICLSHKWIDATCDAPKTCELCGKSEGEPLVHQWKPATYEAPMTCALCGKSEGIALVKNDTEVIKEDEMQASAKDVTEDVREATLAMKEAKEQEEVAEVEAPTTDALPEQEVAEVPTEQPTVTDTPTPTPEQPKAETPAPTQETGNLYYSEEGDGYDVMEDCSSTGELPGHYDEEGIYHWDPVYTEGEIPYDHAATKRDSVSTGDSPGRVVGIWTNGTTEILAAEYDTEYTKNYYRSQGYTFVPLD